MARLLPWKRLLFHRALKLSHKYLPLRENPKYYALKCFSGARRIFLEVGQRLCAQGFLEDREDVFFLTLSELNGLTGDGEASGEDIKTLVGNRKREWEGFLAVEPPFVVRSDGVPFALPEEEKPAAGSLSGTAASAGKVRGRARVILDPADGCALDKGEILVAPYTDPGWTPLFLTAAALVMEVGGVMSHGAVVAREYGIPAVVGVKGATTAIRNGDEIVVDGYDGTVFLPSKD
jgi:pyruvate,water dikinase